MIRTFSSVVSPDTGATNNATMSIIRYQYLTQWRRQGLMVGETHLVGETNIFNAKYIIHEYSLPSNCRPPPGRYLLVR